MISKSECITDSNGSKRWYLNGVLHRDEIDPITGLTLPAVEDLNGDKYWLVNGKRHRVDGPAVVCANGNKYWCLNNELHREDGPAVEVADGRTQYWLRDKCIPELDNKRIYGKDKLAKYLLLL